MKVAYICLLVFYLACSKNIPLQLEIGLIRFEDLVTGKLQYQEITFDQPFIRTPQIALTINSIGSYNGQVYFSKIQNVTAQGFTIGVLSGTEKQLEFRYMAVVDDRIQINCLNFKVKSMVFVPFEKQFVKTPKTWVFLTGVRQSTNDLTVQQDIRNEGIMLKIQQTDTQLLGVCIVAGAVDILQSEIEDLPKFQGYNVMKQQIAFSIIAQSSFICEDECLLYFRNDSTKQLKISTQFKDKPINTSKFISFNKNETFIPNKVETFIQNQLNDLTKISEQQNEPDPGLPKESGHSENLKMMISKQIEQLEEQINHPNGQESFDTETNQLNNEIISDEMISEQNSTPQIMDEQGEETEDETKRFISFRQKEINMEEELKQLEKISNDRTKKIDILEFHPKESVNISFLYKESIVPQSESTAEKLIELKYIDRAPKFSPKIQQMIDEAKKGISKETEQPTIEKEIYSDIKSLKTALEEKKQSLIDQIQATVTLSEQSEEEENFVDTIVRAPVDVPIISSPIKKTEEVRPAQKIEIQEIKKKEVENVSEMKKQEIHEYDTIFAQFANNSNLRQNKPKQSFSSPLIEAEIPIELPEEEPEPIQVEPKKLLNPREERLQKYLQKADEVDLNFLDSISLQREVTQDEIEQQTQQQVNDAVSVSYIEQLNNRKNQILQELQQKYNIKPLKVQSFEEFQLKVPQDQYPQILYEKYLEQLKKQSIGTSFIETNHNGKSVDQSYQLEAAYYEWQLQQNI